MGDVGTHSILDNAEFLELLAQGLVVRVPGQTAVTLLAGAHEDRMESRTQ